MYHTMKVLAWDCCVGHSEGFEAANTESRGSIAELGLCTWQAEVTARIHCTQVNQPPQTAAVLSQARPRKNKDSFVTLAAAKTVFFCLSYIKWLQVFFSILATNAIFHIKCRVFVTASLKRERWTFVLNGLTSRLWANVLFLWCHVSVLRGNTSEIWRSVQMKGPLLREEKGMVAYL